MQDVLKGLSTDEILQMERSLRESNSKRLIATEEPIQNENKYVQPRNAVKLDSRSVLKENVDTQARQKSAAKASASKEVVSNIVPGSPLSKGSLTKNVLHKSRVQVESLKIKRQITFDM